MEAAEVKQMVKELCQILVGGSSYISNMLYRKGKQEKAC